MKLFFLFPTKISCKYEKFSTTEPKIFLGCKGELLDKAKAKV